MLHQTAVSRFPDSKQINEKYSDVGGLIFLRLFCVAIVQPEEMIGGIISSSLFFFCYKNFFS